MPSPAFASSTARVILFGLLILAVACAPRTKLETSFVDVESTSHSSSSDSAKSSLRVLYVGPNPDSDPKIPGYVTGTDAQRMVVLTKERMGAFRTFLESHFENVTFINVEDYEASLSDACDVTIFDARPPAIGTRDVGGWKKELRLPRDFTKPALMVGEVAPMTLGRFGYDLKLDHL